MRVLIRRVLPYETTIRGAMGLTFQRMVATNVTSTNRMAVVTAELVSPRAVWNTVAHAIKTTNPAAAQATSRG